MARKSKKLPRLENTWIADFYEILGTSGAGKRAAAGQLFRAARGGVKTFRAPPGHVVVPVTAEVPQYQPASAKTIREKYEASPEGRAMAQKLAARASKKAAPAASAAPLTPPKRRGRPPKATRATPAAEVSLEQMPAAMMAPAMPDADDLSRRMAARRARADMRRSNIAAKRAAAAQAAEVARRAEAVAAEARRVEMEAETKREAERAAREREAAEAAAREAEREAERKRAEAEAAERAKTAAPSQAEIQMASNAVREALRATIAELRASLKK